MEHFLSESHKHICIKRTLNKGTYQRWFWNKKSGGITNSSGQKIELHKLDRLNIYGSNIRDLNRTELQVGDRVLHESDKLYFGCIIGDTPDYWIIDRNNGDRVEVEKGHDDLILVDHNINRRSSRVPDKNLVFAQTQSELNMAELQSDLATRGECIEQIANLSMGESLFKDLHRRIFSPIYTWGGKYRSEIETEAGVETVVGNREYPTLEIDKVEDEMEIFFRKLANPYLRRSRLSIENLVDALELLHIELARIHPFKDGNGRTIRLFSELVALRWGYKLEWGSSKGNYHDAVRIAVNFRLKRKLRKILTEGLSEL